MQIPDKVDYIQWFCGFYEGEGWISNDIGNNNRIRLGIAQNDKTPLELGQQLWGGVIKRRVRKSPASDKICTGYEWVLPHVKSLIFINDIRKYMIIPKKIEQVDKVIEKFNKGEKLKYTCHYCDKEYANPSARRRHEKTTHLHTDASCGLPQQEDQIAGTP